MIVPQIELLFFLTEMIHFLKKFFIISNLKTQQVYLKIIEIIFMLEMIMFKSNLKLKMILMVMVYYFLFQMLLIVMKEVHYIIQLKFLMDVIFSLILINLKKMLFSQIFLLPEVIDTQWNFGFMLKVLIIF